MKTAESERMSRPLAEVDPDVYQAILHETERQHSQLELIASENFISEAVLEAAGSVFTNKYAEGYPGKRYYGGCEFTDVVENLARDRAKKLFGAEHANVQPHSGSQANQAAYAAVLQPGDTILGMNLAHGGHLTHGHKLNFSGKTYNIVPYGVRKDDERIDYDELARLAAGAQAEDDHRRRQRLSAHARFRALPPDRRFRRRAVPGRHGAYRRTGGRRPASQSLPVRRHRHLHHAQDAARPARRTHPLQREVRRGHRQDRLPRHPGRPAGARHRRQSRGFQEAMEPGFVEYQKQVVANAQALAAGLMDAGFRVVSGGTDTHLMLVDVFSKGVRGKEAEAALDRARITVNKNAIPFDVNPPLNPSGIRLGSPAVTTRGFGEAEMREVAVSDRRSAREHNVRHADDAIAAVRRRVETLTERFPLYAWKRQAVLARA